MMFEDEVTFLIKTFEREYCLKRLLDSIKKYYPNNRVIILNDSFSDYEDNIQNDNFKYIRTEYDIGLSEGRNRQVEQCETEYLIIFDDDFLVVENSNLEMLYNIITENKALDMVGGVKMDEGEAPDPFKGKLEVIDGSVCKHINKTIGSIREYKLYDFIPNFFITKTSILKEFKWDSRMKVAPEHLDFFLTHKNKFLITYTESVMVYHHKSWATTDKDYKKLRMRRDYYNVFYEKHNVSRIRERHEA